MAGQAVDIDATGIIAQRAGAGIVFAVGSAAPTASAVGYAPGCLYINTGGSGATLCYINTGTKSSATWSNVVTTLTA